MLASEQDSLAPVSAIDFPLFAGATAKQHMPYVVDVEGIQQTGNFICIADHCEDSVFTSSTVVLKLIAECAPCQGFYVSDNNPCYMYV